jgi:hypothetical protein
LASPKGDSRDIRQKIINYRKYFSTGRYKRHGELFGASFNGFRMLLLANLDERRKGLCRVVREMTPSDFIWVSDQKRLFVEGAGGAIWARGGKCEDPLQSILGKLAMPTPLPGLQDLHQ